MFRSLGQVHPPEPDRDGPGRDDDHSMAIVSELDCSFNNQGEDGENGLVRLLIHNGTRPFLLSLAVIITSMQAFDPPILMTIVRCFGRLMMTSARLS